MLRDGFERRIAWQSFDVSICVDRGVSMKIRYNSEDTKHLMLMSSR